MPYTLRHLFDPDFDYQNLTPSGDEHGRVDHFNLGYVQNVTRGQLLADWQEGGDANTRHVFAEPVFPAGENTAPDPDDPMRLLATEDGYVHYLDGKITVKTLLNVRSDVDFHTGNIDFVGDVVVHGDVRSGFRVRGRNVTLLGAVEAAEVQASESITAHAGIRGGGAGLVEAGRDIVLPFCENVILKAGHTIKILGSSLHSDIYAGRRLAVQGKLIGGTVHAGRLVYAGERLGGGLGVETHLVLGYDPARILAVERLEDRIEKLEKRISLCSGTPESLTAEESARCGRDLQRMRARLEELRKRKVELWKRIGVTARLDSCKVIVPGELRPCVEISMGKVFLRVNDFMNDVAFRLEGDEIVHSSPALPAGKKAKANE